MQAATSPITAVLLSMGLLAAIVMEASASEYVYGQSYRVKKARPVSRTLKSKQSRKIAKTTKRKIYTVRKNDRLSKISFHHIGKPLYGKHGTLSKLLAIETTPSKRNYRRDYRVRRQIIVPYRAPYEQVVDGIGDELILSQSERSSKTIEQISVERKWAMDVAAHVSSYTLNNNNPLFGNATANSDEGYGAVINGSYYFSATTIGFARGVINKINFTSNNSLSTFNETNNYGEFHLGVKRKFGSTKVGLFAGVAHRPMITGQNQSSVLIDGVSQGLIGMETDFVLDRGASTQILFNVAGKYLFEGNNGTFKAENGIELQTGVKIRMDRATYGPFVSYGYQETNLGDQDSVQLGLNFSYTL